MPMPLSPRLTPSQVADYNREGYLIYPQPVFSPQKFAGLKACFEEILANLPEGFSPEAMDVPHFSFPQLYQWLFDDEVLALVAPILGDDIALFSSHFISKPGYTGKRVPWHEDSAYWRDYMQPMEVVTVWLAIDPSTCENGCMRVIPRTQGNGFSDYEPVDPQTNVFSTEIVRGQRDMSRAVPIELQPNQASLHSAKLQHGSEANASPLRRCGYTMRYISTHTKVNDAKIGSFQKIFLAHGVDHAGNVYGDPRQTYMEMARTRSRLIKSGH